MEYIKYYTHIIFLWTATDNVYQEPIRKTKAIEKERHAELTEASRLLTNLIVQQVHARCLGKFSMTFYYFSNSL